MNSTAPPSALRRSATRLEIRSSPSRSPLPDSIDTRSLMVSIIAGFSFPASDCTGSTGWPKDGLVKRKTKNGTISLIFIFAPALVDSPRLAGAGGGAGRLPAERGVRVEPGRGVEMPGVAGGETGADFLPVTVFCPHTGGEGGNAHARAVGLYEVDAVHAAANQGRLAARLVASHDLRRARVQDFVEQHQLRARRVAGDLGQQALAIAVAELADPLARGERACGTSVHAATRSGFFRTSSAACSKAPAPAEAILTVLASARPLKLRVEDLRYAGS